MLNTKKTKMETLTEIPKCTICNKPMKNAYDSILKKINPYLWKSTCEHMKRLRLSKG